MFAEVIHFKKNVTISCEINNVDFHEKYNKIWKKN